MYLKFIRHPTSSDTLRIGSLYRVHFKPNMMGGYTEILTFICYAYEIIDHQKPSALIYPLTIRNVTKRQFLNYGLGKQRAMLYLPYNKERDTLLSDIQHAINHRQDIRIDICEPQKQIKQYTYGKD